MIAELIATTSWLTFFLPTNCCATGAPFTSVVFRVTYAGEDAVHFPALLRHSKRINSRLALRSSIIRQVHCISGFHRLRQPTAAERLIKAQDRQKMRELRLYQRILGRIQGLLRLR